MEKIDVFVDTNLIDYIITNFETFEDIRFCTFEKCVYEYFNGSKRLFWDIIFLKNCINGKKCENNIMKTNTRDIIIKACTSKYFSKKDLLSLLGPSNIKGRLKYFYGITKEEIYQEDEVFVELKKNYCVEPNIEGDTILYLFYKNINYQFLILEKSINQFFKIYLYEEVFSPFNTANFLRDMLFEGSINVRDLEMVMACICNNCNIFITSDEKLIHEVLTIGMNHLTQFIFIDPKSEGSAIEKIHSSIENYRLIYDLT